MDGARFTPCFSYGLDMHGDSMVILRLFQTLTWIFMNIPEDYSPPSSAKAAWASTMA
jgi:hypothetical protein